MNNLHLKTGYRVLPWLVALACAHIGEVFAVDTPDAGTLQQQIRPQLPATPSEPSIDLPEAPDTGVQDNTPFLVNKISIDGNLSIATDVLYGLVKSYEGSTHTISDMQQACKLITEYYRALGYPFARAVLPQQEITQGDVRIQVIEAKFGSIHLDNNSTVTNSLVESTVKQLQSGQPITQKALDRTLLLLSDIPGVTTSANIKPGQAIGESDFDIALQSTARVNAKVTLDDFGNKYINRPRLSGLVNINNPLHHGDVLSLNVLSTGERMQYGQISYEWLLNGLGSRMGAAYSYLSYRLGGELKKQDVHGNAETSEAWVKHPLIRSRSYNLSLQAKYQHNVLHDRNESTTINNDRHLDNGILSLNGDWRDAWLGGGVNSYYVNYVSGQKHFDNTVLEAADEVTTDTEGHFEKWGYNLNRTQTLTDRTQLWLSVTGQIARDNLDSSQKMVFGGPYSVRAYDNGTVSADTGTLFTAELRHFLGQAYGSWQGLLFVDSGQVEINHTSWATNTGKNNAHLAGAGLGLNWFGPQRLQVRAFAAASIGSANSLVSGGDNTIGWVEVSQAF